MSATTMQSLLFTMFEHAKPTLSDEDVSAAAQLTGCAADEARRMAELCGGIGCLVASEGGVTGAIGSFQEAGSVATLLFALQHSFDTIAAMASIGEEAEFELRKRQATKTKEGKQ